MATFTVTNANDSGAGSLRQAVLDADDTTRADTIVFGAGFDGGAEDVIRLTGGQIRIREALTIDGGDGVTITGDAAGNDRTDADGITDVAASGARRLDDNSRIFNTSAELTLDGLTLTGGRTTANDAGGGAVRALGRLTLSNSTVSGNSTAGDRADGGGIEGDVVTVTNSNVSGNSSTARYGAYGGGIDGSTVSLENSRVSSNSATGDGGGVNAFTVIVRTSTVSGNSSGESGGGINSFELTTTNSTIDGNSAAELGGGIYGYDVDVRNSVISGNSAGRNDFGAGGGGISGYFVTVANSTVSGNSAARRGGGIDGPFVTVKNSTISGNTARDGGGIAADFRDFSEYVYGALQLTNSIVLGNTATIADADEFLLGIDVKRVLAGGNIIGRDVFSGTSDIGDTSARQLFDRTVVIADGVLAGRLADNGGPTWTIALNPDVANPALGGAKPGKAPADDQRGEPRDAAPDLGAFEAAPVAGLVLVGGRRPDALTGASLADQLYGRGGGDELRGRAGGDQLRGEAGRDWLAGGKGDDGLDGGASRDKLVGKRGDDRLFGGDGDDSLRGGPGDDLMSGGRGADAFVFAPDFGRDRVARFDANPAGVQDLIDLRVFEISARRFPERVLVEDLGRHTRIMVDDEGVILLRGVSGEGADAIDEADFLL